VISEQKRFIHHFVGNFHRTLLPSINDAPAARESLIGECAHRRQVATLTALKLFGGTQCRAPF
jgi:hypothetical protein